MCVGRNSAAGAYCAVDGSIVQIFPAGREASTSIVRDASRKAKRRNTAVGLLRPTENPSGVRGFTYGFAGMRHGPAMDGGNEPAAAD